ncbi:MAG: GNAT family N-acetyltransferase [Anaerolineales bacterium]|nr:MAG: GNAT family N-acetyltransferase [Anaerolineales bacterium]
MEEKANHDLKNLAYAPDIPDLTFRGYSGPQEHEWIAAVIQRCLDADGVSEVITADDIARRFAHMQNFDPTQDVLLVEIQGDLIGYARMNWLRESNGDVIFRHHGCVIPEWRRKGIGSTLLHYTEDHLKGLANHTPKDGLRFLEIYLADTESDTQDLVKNAGYQPIRYFFEMVRPLDADIPEIGMPEGLEILPVNPNQYRTVFDAADEAFEDHWGHIPATDAEYQWWVESPDFQPERWKVAWDNGQVAGMVLNYIKAEENERFNRKRCYTEDISVRRPWRRRGLARSLLAQSLQMFKDEGMEEAALGVDTDNLSGALALYEDLGFQTNKLWTAYRKLMA